jgi:Spy/CpxP family protein refolding chaperone
MLFLWPPSKRPEGTTAMKTLTTRILLGLATFGFTGMLASSAQAAPAAGDKQDRSERMCSKLACSADQKAKIKQIHAGKAPQMKAAKDNLRALRDQVRAELQKPSPDAKLIANLDARIASQQTALHSQRRASQLQVLALLTPEQKTKFLAHDGKGKHGKGKRAR